MRELRLWKFVLECLAQDHVAGLMVVVDSSGSSPGRIGFKMAVAVGERMMGSIGGGIMEHKLVEYVRDRLAKRQAFWETKRQIHSKEVVHDQSGMICSGEQTIALLMLTPQYRTAIQTIIDHLEAGEKVVVQLDAAGFMILPYSGTAPHAQYQHTDAGGWLYQEVIGHHEVAHVIGAGHVGLEMCKVLAGLDFFVVNYDDRPGLNTLEENTFAHRKVVTPYADLGRYIQDGPDVYVIVMTFGYRGDDEAVRALLGRSFRYFGMMGSEAKVEKLLGDLRRDGFAEADIAAIRTPAGLVAHCKTPAEIAVSIAAEMVGVRCGE